MKIRCATCDELHDLSDMQVGYERPDAWYALHPDQREERWEIDPDLAVLDESRFFIRGVLPVSVHGEAHPYAWGVWAVVDEADFRRYDALYDEPDGWREPPFAGRLANQLPGYPQTLGLSLTIQLGEGNGRPSFTVDDGAHPLAAEQRDGVYLERVLEMLSPLLHGAAPEPRGRARSATLEEDRWHLLDVLENWRGRGPGVLWFPDAETRDSVPVGALAKLLWEIVVSDTDGRAVTHVERMWVEVDHREGDGDAVLYSGTLQNDPFNPGLVRRGARAWFGPRHVADVLVREGDPMASEAAGARCGRHGPSFPAYLCGHLVAGAGQGFHVADDPANPRPDAWCDRCEALLRRTGAWDDALEAFAEVTMVCGRCYDLVEADNRRE